MLESSLAPPPSNRKPNWIYITPLAIAILPLIRIGLRHNPPLRNKVFYGAVGVFFIHGMWLISRTEEDEVVTKETYIRAPVARVRNPSTTPVTPLSSTISSSSDSTISPTISSTSKPLQ